MILYLAIIVGIATVAGFADDTVWTARLALSVSFFVSCITLYVAWFRLLKERPPARELPRDQCIWTAGFVQIYHTSINIYREFPALKWFLVSTSLIDAGIHALGTIALTYLTDTLNFTARDTGVTFLLMLVGSLPGAWLTGPTIERFNPIRSCMLGTFVMLINCIAAAVVLKEPGQELAAYAFSFIWGVGTGWKWTTDRLLVSTLTPEGQDTELMGVFLFAGQILTWLPPLIFTTLNEAGVSQRYGIGMLSVFFFLGIIALLCMGNYQAAVEHAGRMHAKANNKEKLVLPHGDEGAMVVHATIDSKRKNTEDTVIEPETEEM